jgi:hypothetical protein
MSGTRSEHARRVRIGVIIAILCLLLGAATTYVSAWVLMNTRHTDLSHKSTGFRTSLENKSGWVVRTDSRPGAQWVQCLPLRPESRGSERHPKLPLVPDWSLSVSNSPVELGREFGVTERFCLWERGAGWPLIAIIDREAFLYDSDRYVRMWSPTVGWGRRPVYGVWHGIAIAFRPVWPGFVVNTAVFSVTWLLVTGMVVGAVRFTRKRAGCCPRCRYDLAGLSSGICPECGAKIEVASAANSSQTEFGRRAVSSKKAN